MKVKKLKEAKIDQLYQELLNVEQMVNTVEWTAQNMAVVAEMKKAHATLEAMQRELSPEKVAELMDDINDAIQTQKEVDAILSGSGLSVDESDLEAELDALEADMSGTPESGISADLVGTLPLAPTTIPELRESSLNEQVELHERVPALA